LIGANTYTLLLHALADRAATRLTVQAPAVNATLLATSTLEDAGLAPSQDTISQDAEENLESSAVLISIL
jgi:hypothetical protein